MGGALYVTFAMRLLLLLLLFPVLVSPQDSCVERCKALPKSNVVTCLLQSSYHVWPACDAEREMDSGPCPVRAGMDAELICNLNTSSVYRSAPREAVAGGVLRSAHVEDGGEYVCTDDGTGMVLHRRNVFVDGNLACMGQAETAGPRLIHTRSYI